MNNTQIVNYLHKKRLKGILMYLKRLEKKPYNIDLGNITNLLARIGNPHLQLKCIHIAGTNGKGSTAAMISTILQYSGYKVGLYTSPHLMRLEERFRINSRDMPEKELVYYFNRIWPYISNETHFELTTALAFLYFKEKKVDFLVLETGMGGRLDATNVCMPLISIITNIGLEHTQYLGATIEKISYEKAGIIKPRIPVVTGAEGRALAVIRKIARQSSAPLFVAQKPANYTLNLKGEFQNFNAAIALKTIDVLERYGCIRKIPEKIKRKALQNVHWPGRFEFLTKNILVDGAHNPDGMRALVHELGKLREPLIFLVGILQDKNKKEMLSLIEPLAKTIILTKVSSTRAAEPVKLLQYIKDKEKAVVVRNPKKAMERAKTLVAGKDVIVVTGSLYMVGELYPQTI